MIRLQFVGGTSLGAGLSVIAAAFCHVCSRRFLCTRAHFWLLCFLLVLLPLAAPVAVDTFGSGASLFEIEFVSIGNPGNPPDMTDRPVTDGAVPYEYRIGKYEISEQMIDKANALGGLGITTDTRGPDKPATSVTWFEAARFVNWLNMSTGNTPAYKFDSASNFQLWNPADPGYNPANLYRNRLAKYFLPSIDEWHKAAYYDPVAGVYYDYPTGSDVAPDGIDFVSDLEFDAVFDDGADNPTPNVIYDVGTSSPYGTFGQGGNVFEWEETAFDRVDDLALEGRGLRGGSWTGELSLLFAANRNGLTPIAENELLGIRVASVVPEPNTGLLIKIMAVGVAVMIIIQRKSVTGLGLGLLIFMLLTTNAGISNAATF